jgi:hypothetical protein
MVAGQWAVAVRRAILRHLPFKAGLLDISELSIRRNGRILTATIAPNRATATTPRSRTDKWAIRIQQNGETLDLPGPDMTDEDTEQSVIQMLEDAADRHSAQA